MKEGMIKMNGYPGEYRNNKNCRRKFAAVLVLIYALFCRSLFSFADGLTDLEGHWARAAIEKAVEEGYVKGYPDSTFRPDNVVTRAEFVAMVNAAYIIQAIEPKSGFKDVKDTDWYARDIAAAAEAGYVSGYDDNTFKPNQHIKREEAACLIVNLTKMTGGAKKNFADSSKIDFWAQDAVNILVLNGVMSGYPDGTFRPTGNLTRAEAVAIIGNALNNGTNTVIETFLEVTGSDVCIRTGPDTLYDVVDHVKKGETLKATAISKNGWYKVEYDNVQAWVTGQYVKEISENDVSENDDESDENNGGISGAGISLQVTGDIVNLRSGPGTEYSIVGKAKQGDILIASDMSENGWYRIRFNNSEAWIIGQYASVIGEVNRGNDDRNADYSAAKNDGITIVTIDAGHGGSDTGAIGVNGIKEKDINLAIALKVSDYLEQSGCRTVMTRTDDTFVPLLERSSISDNAHADVFVSIHANAATGTAVGIETLVQALSPSPVYPYQEDSMRLAELIHSELINTLGAADRGVKRQNLSVCRETYAPAVLVETGFIDNAGDAALLSDEDYQDRAAQAIAAGIIKYFQN